MNEMNEKNPLFSFISFFSYLVTGEQKRESEREPGELVSRRGDFYEHSNKYFDDECGCGV